MSLEELYTGCTKEVTHVRIVGSATRHVAHLNKRVITIGWSNCDILVKEAGTAHTSVLQVELASGGARVSMLWNAAVRRLASTRTSASAVGSSSAMDRARAAGPSVIAHHKPRMVKYGEAFVLGHFEAMLLPYA